MPITVTLYSFTKRENSTKRPSSGGTDYSCTLIDNTSLMNPTFKLSIASNPIGKNYCYVSDFNRYYFITDIVSYQNFWHISCTCDVLASFKTEIGSQSHYVLRSSSDHDEYISDNFYGCKINRTSVRLPQSGVLAWSTGHSYIVGIVSNAANASEQVGSITYYQMDDLGLKNFVYYLMHDIGSYCNITTAPYTDVGVQEALLNPIQYIVSCIAVPITFPTTYTGVSQIRFGYYFWNVLGSGKYRVIELGETKDEYGIITLPKHPQANARGKFMNGAPFTENIFHLGPFGDIPIDPADCIDVDNLGYRITYDLAQGVGRLAVGPAIWSETQIGHWNFTSISYCGTTMVGAPINLTQVLTNPLQAQVSWQTGMNNVVGTGVGAGLTPSTLKNLLSAQNVLTETYADAAKNRYPSVNGVGTPGSFINFFDHEYGCYLLAKFMRVVDENNTEIGRPLCKTKQINTLSGFILCQMADCHITGTQDEAQKINGYLNSGFFYE